MAASSPFLYTNLNDDVTPAPLDSPPTPSTQRKSAAGKGKSRKSKPSSSGEKHLFSKHSSWLKKTRCDKKESCSSCRVRGEPCVWLGALPVETKKLDEFPDTTPGARAEIIRLRKIIHELATRLGEDPATYDPPYGSHRATSSDPPSHQISSPDPEGTYFSLPPSLYRAELPDFEAPSVEGYWSMPRSEWGANGTMFAGREETLWGERTEGEGFDDV